MTQKTSLPVIWPDNMRPGIAAKYLGVSDSKLAKLRMEPNRHLGPRFIKAAGCIVYRRSDLDDWLESHLVEAA
ncbi:helix-turn-helix domain-containing protein [Psychromarinibacter sp. C21-152]|uniref:Helix-turn-helix domain-containing protein n=1 Tax=Psychromarinibacter sediminicola TaxID=3033385 RepID=A0AAE3NXW3_9RHOB|nr:helix-turn-helix domain-containing protein [Psychromarinibacter sediminicola]MDF0603991.1 helix-turn-helix domain-containing protein [Psychromarinibacter sediminicola]